MLGVGECWFVRVPRQAVPVPGCPLRIGAVLNILSRPRCGLRQLSTVKSSTSVVQTIATVTGQAARGLKRSLSRTAGTKPAISQLMDLEFPTSGANSPDPAQDSQAGFPRPLGGRAALFSRIPDWPAAAVHTERAGLLAATIDFQEG